MQHPFHDIAERCIAVLFVMTKSDTDIKVDPDEFWRTCKEFRVFDMTNEKFKRWKEEHVGVQISKNIREKGSMYGGS